MNIKEFINLYPNKLHKYSKVKELNYRRIVLNNPKNLLRFKCYSFNQKEFEKFKTNMIASGHNPYLVPCWNLNSGDTILKFGNGFCIPEGELEDLYYLFRNIPDEGYFQVGYQGIHLYDGYNTWIDQYNALLLFDKVEDVSKDFIYTGNGWVDYKNAEVGRVPILLQFGSKGIQEYTGEVLHFCYHDLYEKSKELVDSGLAEEAGFHPEFPGVKLFKLPYLSDEQTKEFSLAYYSLQSGNNMSIFCSLTVADFIDRELGEGDYYEEDL